MADPRNYRPGPYGPGYSPQQNQQHQQHQQQHQQHQHGYNTGFYPQQPRPGPPGVGGMPIPPQSHFNSGPHQPPYPPVFNGSNHNVGYPHPTRPGPGPGPGPGFNYGPSGNNFGGTMPGGGGRPSAQSYRPGTPPPQHTLPSPMMTPQMHSLRHQEWPVAGRPPSNMPAFPPNVNSGFGPISNPHGQGHEASGYIPKPYAPPISHSNPPSHSGPGAPPHPSFSPSVSTAATSPSAAMPKHSDPSSFPNLRPPTNSNPLTMPQPSTYRPKTSYQPTSSFSPKKESKKPLSVPSPSLSWQSATSGTSIQNHHGYQSSQSQHRPPLHPSESFDADDRPTELIPILDDHSPGHAHLSAQHPPSTSSTVPPSPTLVAVSPSPSFTTISYLPASPGPSDLENRPTELPVQDVFQQHESSRKANTVPMTQPMPLAPSTPLSAPITKFPTATTFVPSTTYKSTKKEAFKAPPPPQPSNTNNFDTTVKVEVSSVKVEVTDVKISSNQQQYSNSYKVSLNNPPVRQQSNASLDSPISLDGLMDSIEAMARPSSSPLVASTHQGPTSQQLGSADYFKPLPVIKGNEAEQKRYSLSDAPVASTSSPGVSRLVPKSHASSHLPPFPEDQGDLSNTSNPNVSNTATRTTQPSAGGQSNVTLSHGRNQGELEQASFQHNSTVQSHPPHNHNHIGGNAMMLFSQPEFVHNPITSMAALADRPEQKAPSMVRRGKTLRRAAGVTGANHQVEQTLVPPPPPTKVTSEELYPYLLRLVLLAQEDEAPPPTPALPVTNKDTHKDLVKVLRSKVKDILSGKDQNPAYQDSVVKKALSNMEPKQFKASTNAEELMLGFSIEMSRIQQTMNIPTNNRDAQISIMVNLLREAIQQDPFVGHEAILQRLDKQVKTTATKPNNSTAQAEEHTKVIKELFKHLEAVRHQRMNDLRRNSTRQAAIEDLKKCLSNLELDSFPYPGMADYHHREHHEEFKTRERSALNGFIRGLSAGRPNLMSINTPSRLYHPNEFTFIPENPKAYYHVLLEMCVDHAIASRKEDDPAANLLSTPTRALLIDCGVRWRLTSSWREIMYMEIIKERYREGKVSVHFLLDFLQTKFYKDSEVHQWHISEVNMLGDVYGGLNHMIFDNINHDIKDLESVSAAYFRPMMDILDRVHQQEVYQRLNIDLTPFFEDIKETVLLESIRSYNAKDAEVQKEGYENETVPLTKMALYIVSEHGIMKKRFPQPLFGAVDVAAIVVENNLRNFVPLMQNMANMDAKKLPMADVFPLYQLCRELVTLFELYAPSSSAHFNISTWFKPYVHKYLEMLDASITEWVTAAIKQDQFEEVSVGAGHSSSASDLFAFFYEPLTWVKGLNWPDDYQRAIFISSLAKVFCKAVDLYAQYMETMFHGCMPSSVSSVASTESKTLTEQLASFTFRSESTEAKKAAQFVFTPKMCVLVNNIEAVRQRLDELYRNMDVDNTVQTLRDHQGDIESDPNAPQQFEIIFVCAERLQPMDSNEASDPFIVMSHENKEVFRSKTIYANINPRWNEVYQVTLTKEITYHIQIFDADKMHKDRLCGSQYLIINPEDYEDYMAHDVWLDLIQIGRLLLRITMKGERDDVQFFFGRTFRSLKRKEADMSGMIVDAMVPCAQACLTEKVLFSNFRSKALFPFFSSSVSSAKVTKVSDEDCDNALGQLIDYLEASLPVLYDYLTTEGMTLVITRLWKEILITIESLLMPPLSNTVSDRTPLTEIEMHVVFKIVEFIKLYLNGGDAGDGFPLKVLEIPKYRDLLTVRPIYDASTEELIAEYNRALTVPGRGRLARQQSDYDRRAGGVAKRPSADSMTPNPETILRILRMRHDENVEPFLKQAIETQSKIREERAQAKRKQLVYQRQIQRDQL